MTLIAAMKESDTALLIASDSAVLEQPGDIPLEATCKLRKHPTAPLTWGCSGDTDIADRFDSWMNSISWPPADWQQLSDQCADRLAELNGQVRKRAVLAGLDPNRVVGTDLLVVGWFRGPNILEVDSMGKVSQYIANGFHAIGRGKRDAYVVHTAFRGLEGLSRLQIFRAIGITAIRTAKDCAFPIHIWRVTAEGVSDVQTE